MSSSSSSMTKTIRIHSFCACGGVFVVRSVVDDNKRYESIQFAPSVPSFSFAPSSMTTNDTNSFNLRLQCRLCCLLRRRRQRTIRIHSCWQPTWSSFCRISAVGRSTPIVIDILTLTVVGSALVIHRAFALFLSNVPPYALLWVG